MESTILTEGDVTMSHVTAMDAPAALEKLKEGNRRYLESKTNPGDISPELRAHTCQHGQNPYAVVITCSDSRVIPESIFTAGIGEIFTIRVAGNVMDNHQMGSVEYAADHLGCKLVVVLGHDHCGAVGAALGNEPLTPFVQTIVDEIRKAVGTETDPTEASCKNVRQSVAYIRDRDGGRGLTVCGAMYHIQDGRVEFFED